jgi:hypothetical protein
MLEAKSERRRMVKGKVVKRGTERAILFLVGEVERPW